MEFKYFNSAQKYTDIDLKSIVQSYIGFNYI